MKKEDSSNNPRLSPEQLAALLLKREQQKPSVLGEAEFREHVDHTILHREKQAEAIVDSACEKLREIAARMASKQDQMEINDTVQILNDAVGAFQHAMTWKNCANAGGLSVGKHVILWPQAGETKI